MEDRMKSLIGRFVREDQGQVLIEYALLATFLSLAAAVGAGAAGTALDGWYNAIGSKVNDASAAVAGIALP
jgi:Flp pilus assembly pilin Flp